MYCIISHLVEYATANHMQVFSQFNFIRKFILDYKMFFFFFFWKWLQDVIYLFFFFLETHKFFIP